MKFILATICCLLIFTCVIVDTERKIIKGVEAKEGQFPYQVYIKYMIDDKEYFYCGGSILSDEQILTAAHCVCKGKNILKNVTVLVGKTNNLALGPWYNVERIKCHEDYGPGLYGNDIALIKLKGKLKFSETWKSITLPDSEIAGYPKLNFSGWGLTNNTNGSITNDLQFIELTVVDCGALVVSQEKDAVCAKAEIRGSGACHGDSGGALVQKNGNDYVQYGIDAHHMVECADGFPTVFTSVLYHINWIRTNMAQL